MTYKDIRYFKKNEFCPKRSRLMPLHTRKGRKLTYIIVYADDILIAYENETVEYIIA